MNDRDDLLDRLARALKAAGLNGHALEALPAKGLTHDHVRLSGTGLLARVPRRAPQTGKNTNPEGHLAIQADAFRRAQPSGHTPRLHNVLLPSLDLPFGGMIVDEITGHTPRLPEDLPAIAQALAALHDLPVPPLDQPYDPLLATVRLIQTRTRHLDHAGLSADAKTILLEQIAWAEQLYHNPPLPLPPPVLVGTDTHPGNFLIDDNGKAWFVDLEKTTYGLAAFDLAHSTVETSTLWDVDAAAVLNETDVRNFYEFWMAAVKPELVEAMMPWFSLARRLMWVRTLSWMVHTRADPVLSQGADLMPAMRQHLKELMETYLSASTLLRMADQLQRPIPRQPAPSCSTA